MRALEAQTGALAADPLLPSQADPDPADPDREASCAGVGLRRPARSVPDDDTANTDRLDVMRAGFAAGAQVSRRVTQGGAVGGGLRKAGGCGVGEAGEAHAFELRPNWRDGERGRVCVSMCVCVCVSMCVCVCVCVRARLCRR